MLWAILLLPWLLYGLIVPFTLRRRPRLRDAPCVVGPGAPLVSVIIPARNEAENIAASMSTVIASSYPNRELIVVDDRSVDGTLDVARAIAARSPVIAQVIEGEPLPEGWVGKPWACVQGVAHARGDLLAFTDADTRHDDELLGRAVGALQATGADLVSVAPRQLMVGFWERLLMPQVFLLIWLRWRDPAALQHVTNPRNAMAGGQFILVRRSIYESAGGHATLRGEVVEDVVLAQRVVARGGRIYLGLAEEYMETRMYRRLREILEGWSKNLAAGARLTVAPWLRPFVAWGLAAFVLALWVLPPAALVVAVLGLGPEGLLPWATGASAAGLVFWFVVRIRFRAHPVFSLLYPLGAAIVAGILLRSALAGRHFSWKGRTYSRRSGTITSRAGA